jgi:hypothetical protein
MKEVKVRSESRHQTQVKSALRTSSRLGPIITLLLEYDLCSFFTIFRTSCASQLPSDNCTAEVRVYGQRRRWSTDGWVSGSSASTITRGGEWRQAVLQGDDSSRLNNNTPFRGSNPIATPTPLRVDQARQWHMVDRTCGGELHLAYTEELFGWCTTSQHSRRCAIANIHYCAKYLNPQVLRETGIVEHGARCICKHCDGALSSSIGRWMIGSGRAEPNTHFVANITHLSHVVRAGCSMIRSPLPP